ncbi:FAD-dependent oxidoreductase [Streptomyces sp. AJS327]|uniref:NAD(P)/FAD-dependent oxidoreductase n=1 Tax=Streptomyces sp. AJS327 TaxID=2545265 RepID=UPI0015DF8261|nr:FAD-dependent oxidoreductase [Streptomyces sp. AJS327]MBA0051845.1 FAD-dependent oxidoreductase [Streptomyces sp. AJS327]
MTAPDPAAVARALAEARPAPFWLDDPARRPRPRPPLTGDEECELLVVGGGYTGLWTALAAKERDPARDVLLLEGRELGWAASGRNGGFCSSSLTHGFANGLARWPGEIDTLEELGARNLDAIEEAVERYGIDCDFERTGEMFCATEPYQAAALRADAEEARRLGVDEGLTFLDRDAVRAEVDSPLFLAGLWDRWGVALLNPARLVWGLARACVQAGVRIHEHSPVRSLTPAGPGRAGLTARTPHGTVRAARAALGTNAFPPLTRGARRRTVPAWDYVLVTEPLTEEQLASVGWRNRQGLGDCGNRFHYFRRTADQRILWGGYDTVYHYGGRLTPAHDQRDATFRRLARHFQRCFPQLAGVRFTHRWGGAVDTSSRFTVFFGTEFDGRLAHASGYTGLGVGASRFGAEVLLDLLDGRDTARTRLELVRSPPRRFPPEPLRWAGIRLTQWSLARADAHAGRRNPWLRALDRAGMGFTS